ncbi:MAG: hydroxyacylglutathione hydrolase [Burkholderiales bacterium]
MIRIEPVRAFRDNYIWCLRDNTRAAVVDPGDAKPVLEYLARERLALTAILNTHHHADHTGGNRELLAHFSVPVFGPRAEAIATVTQTVGEDERVALPDFGIDFSVIDIPGHTRGHVAYYGANLLFCGDTLFGCGCGKLFEGTAKQMHASLSKLAALPPETKVFCGHEYTLANIAFAKTVEPENSALLEREREDARAISESRPTLPSTLAVEKMTNPFLRCAERPVIEAASKHAGEKLHDPVEVFAEIRSWKNTF